MSKASKIVLAASWLTGVGAYMLILCEWGAVEAGNHFLTLLFLYARIAAAIATLLGFLYLVLQGRRKAALVSGVWVFVYLAYVTGSPLRTLQVLFTPLMGVA